MLKISNISDINCLKIILRRLGESSIHSLDRRSENRFISSLSRGWLAYGSRKAMRIDTADSYWKEQRSTHVLACTFCIVLGWSRKFACRLYQDATSLNSSAIWRFWEQKEWWGYLYLKRWLDNCALQVTIKGWKAFAISEENPVKEFESHDSCASVADVLSKSGSNTSFLPWYLSNTRSPLHLQ